MDSHHYENESYKEVFQYIDSPVIRREALVHIERGGRASMMNSQVGYQDGGGRITRAGLRKLEKTPPDTHRDVHMTKMLDGRHGGRLCVPVPDPDAVSRPASAARDGDGAVPGL